MLMFLMDISKKPPGSAHTGCVEVGGLVYLCVVGAANDFKPIGLHGPPDFAVFHLHGEEMVGVIFVNASDSAYARSCNSGADIPMRVGCYINGISNVEILLVFSRIHTNPNDATFVTEIKNVAEDSVSGFHNVPPLGRIAKKQSIGSFDSF